MTSTLPDDPPDQAQREAAAAWLLRLESRELTPAERASLEHWIEQDPRHRAAFEQTRRAWDGLEAHAAGPEVLALRERALARVRRAGTLRRRGPLALAASLAAAVIAFAIWLPLRSPAVETYVTAAGERSVVSLGDGSQVTLDETTRLSVRYTPKRRSLQLLAGQARFDVAHDRSRPFIVTAADHQVLATGTAFNVDLLARGLAVTLLEGRVQVSPTDITAPQAVVELKPGEQLRVTADRRVVVDRGVDLDGATAWQRGKLVFDEEPLASAVQRVNRYAARKIRLAPGAGGPGARVSGVYNSGDAVAFVQGVTAYLPVRAAEQPGGDILLSSSR
jgi:transmembrane sensor